MKREKIWFLVVLVSIIVGGLLLGKYLGHSQAKIDGEEKTIKLPAPQHKGKLSVEEAIFKRKSIRRYKDELLTLKDVSQLLWAAGGKTIDGISGATRAYPSAGGIYPLEIYLVAGNVESLSDGIYHYKWHDHTIRRLKDGDLRRELTRAALGQGMVLNAPASIVFTAAYPRTTGRYGTRGEVRYVPMDMGGAGQNVHLQAESLGLGTVIIGAFQDKAVQEILGTKDETPLYIMPVGRY